MTVIIITASNNNNCRFGSMGCVDGGMHGLDKTEKVLVGLFSII